MARILMKLGLAYQTAFDYDSAQQVFNRAFALWPNVTKDFPGKTTSQVGDLQDQLKSPHPLRLLWQDPPSLDPTLGGYNLTAPIANQLFSGLVSYGPDSEILPDIAHSWEIRDEGQRYIFHLRDDVVWNDEMPVTAYDFEFTYKRALDPTTNAQVAGQLLNAVTGAEAFRVGRLADPDRVGI